MKKIIANEIRSLIHRNPTTEELNSCIQYVEDGSNETTVPEEVKGLVVDWFDDNMRQCENCGEYHLMSEMIKNPNGWFCDQTCEFKYDSKTYSLYELENEEYKANVLNA